MTNDSSSDYPVQFRVEYPDRPRDRGSVLVRILLAIPILIVASLISGQVPLENEGMTGAQAGLGGRRPGDRHRSDDEHRVLPLFTYS